MKNYTYALIVLYSFLLCSYAYSQGSVRTLENLRLADGVFSPISKLFYAQTAYNSNRILEIDPAWGEIKRQIVVGDNPQFLKATADRSTFFFITGNPRRIQRFNTATGQVDQNDSIEILPEDEVRKLFTLPHNNQEVLLMVRRDQNSHYFNVYKNGKPLERYYKFPALDVEGMNIAVTQDSIIWMVSPLSGSISKFKKRSNGLHLEKRFTGYGRSLEFEYTQVGAYLISRDGQYVSFAGETPTVLGRIQLGKEPVVHSVDDSDFFYSIESMPNFQLKLRKFRKEGLKEVASFNVPVHNPAISAYRFYVCNDETFYFQHLEYFRPGDHANFYRLCTTKLSKPLIETPDQRMFFCITDTGFVLKTNLLGSQYVLKKGEGIPRAVPSLRIVEHGEYRLQLSDDTGCLTELSEPAYAYFDAPPLKPVLYESRGYKSPVQMCVRQSLTLNTNSDAYKPNWSTGENGTSIVVKSAGVYRVRTQSGGGCWSDWSDTLLVVQAPDTLPSKPTISIRNKPSNLYCQGDTARFETQNGYKNYMWNWGFVNNAKNTLDLPLHNVFYDYRVQVRVANNDYCVSELSDEVLVRAVYAPQKPVIQRSSNVLMSNNRDPLGVHEWYLNGQVIAGEQKNFLVAKKEGFYTARVKYGNCISPLSDVLAFTGLLTSSQNLTQNQKLHLFPNPATEQLSVQASTLNPSTDWQFSIFDLQGKLQSPAKVTQTNPGVNLSIAHLAAGAYVLRCLSPEGAFLMKFVKQ